MNLSLAVKILTVLVEIKRTKGEDGYVTVYRDPVKKSFETITVDSGSASGDCLETLRGLVKNYLVTRVHGGFQLTASGCRRLQECEASRWGLPVIKGTPLGEVSP